MAKREQEVKQAGRMAQAQAAYKQLMDKIRSYCQQARELREQAAVLQQSGRTDFQVSENSQSFDIYKGYEIKHYVFFTPNDIIEVISNNPPNILEG